MNEIMLAIYESERHGEISLDQRDAMLDILTEGVFSNPLRKFKKVITDIKNIKPKEYDGPEEIKKYVDANYNVLIKSANILENEASDLRKNEVKDILAMAYTSLAPFLGGLMVIISNAKLAGLFGVKKVVTIGAVKYGGVVILASSVIVFIGLIVAAVIDYFRRENDINVKNDLLKIRDSLIKISKTQNIPEETKNKITDIVTSIDDANTEWSLKMKVSESVVDNSLVDSVFESMFE